MDRILYARCFRYSLANHIPLLKRETLRVMFAPTMLETHVAQIMSAIEGNKYLRRLVIISATVEITKALSDILDKTNIKELYFHYSSISQDLVDFLAKRPNIRVFHRFTLVNAITWTYSIQYASLCTKYRVSCSSLEQIVMNSCQRYVTHLEYIPDSVQSFLELGRLIREMTRLSYVVIDTVNLPFDFPESFRMPESIIRYASINKLNIRLRKRLYGFLEGLAFSSLQVSQFKTIPTELITIIASNRRLTYLTLTDLILSSPITFNHTRFTSILRCLLPNPPCRLKLVVYHLTLEDMELLSALQNRGLKEIRLELSGSLENLDYLVSITSIKELRINTQYYLGGWGSQVLRQINKGIGVKQLELLWPRDIVPLETLEDNTTLQELYCSDLSFSEQYTQRLEQLLYRNRVGWNPKLHGLFPQRIRSQIESLIKAQFTQVRYETYNIFPPEILFQIFRYLI